MYVCMYVIKTASTFTVGQFKFSKVREFFSKGLQRESNGKGAYTHTHTHTQSCNILCNTIIKTPSLRSHKSKQKHSRLHSLCVGV